MSSMHEAKTSVGLADASVVKWQRVSSKSDVDYVHTRNIRISYISDARIKREEEQLSIIVTHYLLFTGYARTGS
jgi:hypothetical protein